MLCSFFAASSCTRMDSFFGLAVRDFLAFGAFSSALTAAARSVREICSPAFPLTAPGVEDALDVTMAQRSELDYLIYNDPLGYADLILNGDPEEYLKNVTGSHGLED